MRRDLTGQRFTHLTIMGVYEADPTKWICRCYCGNTIYRGSDRLLSGNVKSCGCLRGQSHGASRSKLYAAHHTMKNSKDGICDEWKNDYIKFQEWAIANGYNDDLVFRRKDTTKCWSPENTYVHQTISKKKSLYFESTVPAAAD